MLPPWYGPARTLSGEPPSLGHRHSACGQQVVSSNSRLASAELTARGDPERGVETHQVCRTAAAVNLNPQP